MFEIMLLNCSMNASCNTVIFVMEIMSATQNYLCKWNELSNSKIWCIKIKSKLWQLGVPLQVIKNQYRAFADRAPTYSRTKSNQLWLSSSLVRGSPNLRFCKFKNVRCSVRLDSVPMSHLEERWLAAWLSRSWFCTDDKSAKSRLRFCHRRKDAVGRACADWFSYLSMRKPSNMAISTLLVFDSVCSCSQIGSEIMNEWIHLYLFYRLNCDSKHCETFRSWLRFA